MALGGATCWLGECNKNDKRAFDRLVDDKLLALGSCQQQPRNGLTSSHTHALAQKSGTMEIILFIN